MSADPYPISDSNRGSGHITAFFGDRIVVQGRKHDLMPDKTVVADLNASLILKTASLVDKDALSDGNVFSEIGVKWRKQSEIFIDFFADQFREQITSSDAV